MITVFLYFFHTLSLNEPCSRELMEVGGAGVAGESEKDKEPQLAPF